MEPFIAKTPHVSAEEKELVNYCSCLSSGRFLAAYGEEVVGLNVLPPGGPSFQHPAVPANYLLSPNSLLEVIWVRRRPDWDVAVMLGCNVKDGLSKSLFCFQLCKFWFQSLLDPCFCKMDSLGIFTV